MLNDAGEFNNSVVKTQLITFVLFQFVIILAYGLGSAFGYNCHIITPDSNIFFSYYTTIQALLAHNDKVAFLSEIGQ